MNKTDLKKYIAPTAEVVSAELEAELLEISIEQPEFSREQEDTEVFDMRGFDVPKF